MSPDFRQMLIEQCQNIVNQKIDVIQESLKQAQDAMVTETKSSAGDKYETSREMIQQDMDRLQRQLAEADKDRIVIREIDRGASRQKEIVELGSLVQTDQTLYFLSVSLGRVECEGKQVYAISPKSPIGVLLMGKMVVDVLKFNGKEQRIMEIW